jgi:hypothetical protein
MHTKRMTPLQIELVGRKLIRSAVEIPGFRQEINNPTNYWRRQEDNKHHSDPTNNPSIQPMHNEHSLVNERQTRDSRDDRAS